MGRGLPWWIYFGSRESGAVSSCWAPGGNCTETLCPRVLMELGVLKLMVVQQKGITPEPLHELSGCWELCWKAPTCLSLCPQARATWEEMLQDSRCPADSPEHQVPA